MKFSKVLIAFFFFAGILFSFSASAQDDREDVVYLKNGNIYRGIIVEQVPGESLKVETIGGNVFTVAISDIVKITKEKKAMPTPAPSQGSWDRHHEDIYRGGDMYRDRPRHHDFYSDTTHHSKNGFHYRNRGYFFQGQLLVEAVEGGGRMVNGYKFGRFGYLGIGLGIDMLFSDVQKNSGGSGVYTPIYLFYGGDIIKKRITPFYSIEAGYATRHLIDQHGNNNMIGTLNGDPSATGGHGGMMGGAGFGVKFYSRHRVYLSLSAHLDFQQYTNDYDNYFYTPGGGVVYNGTSHVRDMIVTPGFRLGFGF